MDRTYALLQPLLKTLAHLRSLDDARLPAAEALQQRLRRDLDGISAAAAEGGIKSEEVEEMRYALVALADEVVLSRSATLRDYWLQRMLQVSYFQENTAGEGFFARLQEIRNKHDRTDALSVYYVCLLCGFRGRYAVRGAEVELQDLIEGVRADLERVGVLSEAALAPAAARPHESLVQSRPNRALLWTAAGAVVLAVLLYAGLRFDLAARVSDGSHALAAAASVSQPSAPKSPSSEPARFRDRFERSKGPHRSKNVDEQSRRADLQEVR